jgi:hypothetical protein
MFPLYTVALPFSFHAGESMVRIAVRTLVLNVYRIDDERLRRFLLSDELSGSKRYWVKIIRLMVRFARLLDTMVRDIVQSHDALLRVDASTDAGVKQREKMLVSLDQLKFKYVKFGIMNSHDERIPGLIYQAK